MDLWIRSQNKRELVLAHHFEVEQFSDEEVSVNVNCYSLGVYKTKKRALEILDEIQNFLTPRFIVSVNSDNDCIENLFDKSTCGKVFPNNKLQIKNINRDCWVYEMPQE